SQLPRSHCLGLHHRLKALTAMASSLLGQRPVVGLSRCAAFVDFKKEQWMRIFSIVIATGLLMSCGMTGYEEESGDTNPNSNVAAVRARDGHWLKMAFLTGIGLG